MNIQKILKKFSVLGKIPLKEFSHDELRENFAAGVENETKLFSFPSFDAWFGPIERGEGLPGQVYAGLPEDVRAAVKMDLHREFGGGEGPVVVEVDVGYGCGWR